MQATQDTITAKQQTAISALLAGKTAKAAATAARISTQTLWRWQHDPVFLQALADQQAAVVDQAARELAGHASTAVKVLAELALGSERDADRIRAAGLILRLTMSNADVDEIEARYALAYAKLLQAMPAQADPKHVTVSTHKGAARP